MNRIGAFAVLLGILAPFGALASTVIDNSDDTLTFKENFEDEPVNQPPDEVWYDSASDGTGGTQIVATSGAIQGTRSYLVTTGSTPYMAGIENVEQNADLCQGPNQFLTFMFTFAAWNDNAQITTVRVADAVGTIASPFNSVDLRITRSGVAVFTYAPTVHIRGQSAAEVTFNPGITITPGTVYTITLSDANCADGAITFILAQGGSNLINRRMDATDAIVQPLDTVSIGTASGTGTSTAYRVDNLEWWNVPETDTDSDGIVDGDDNCPSDSNPDQEDADSDGIGDACEADTDGDGIINDNDNCPGVSNPDQQDLDHNGVGEACQSGTSLGDTFIEDFDDEFIGDNTPTESWYTFSRLGCGGMVDNTHAQSPPHAWKVFNNPVTADCPTATINLGLFEPSFDICETTRIKFSIYHTSWSNGGGLTSTWGGGITSGAAVFEASGGTQDSVFLKPFGGNPQGQDTVELWRNSNDLDTDVSTDIATSNTWRDVEIQITCNPYSAIIRTTFPTKEYALVGGGTTEIFNYIAFGDTTVENSQTGPTTVWVDDLEVSTEGFSFADSVSIPGLVGFDVDDKGINDVITRQAIDPCDNEVTLCSHLDTWTPDTLGPLGDDDDECQIVDGVSTYSEGRDRLGTPDESDDVTWQAALSYWGCPPDDAGNINDLFITDTQFGTYLEDCGFCDEEIQDEEGGVNLPNLGQELHDVSNFPYTFTKGEGSKNCFGIDFGVDCQSVLVAWGFSERTTGQVGVVAIAMNNDAEDRTDTHYEVFGEEGTTTEQICTWRASDKRDYFAAATQDVSPKIWRVDVDTDVDESSAGPGVERIPIVEMRAQHTFTTIKSAQGISCAGAMVAIVTAEGAVDHMKIMCAVTTHGQCTEGQEIAEIETDGTSRGITLVYRPLCEDDDGEELPCDREAANIIANNYYGGYVDGDNIQYFAVEGGVFYTTCTSPLPPGNFKGMEMDMEAQDMWVATGGASGGVYRYDVFQCTTIEENPYLPDDSAGCELCDSDGDGILDGDDPQPENPDCDNDDIPDGEDPEVTCIDNQTGDEVNCTNGICERKPGTGNNAGGDGTGGGGFEDIFNINVPEALCNLLPIILIFLGAYVGYRLSFSPVVIGTGALVGLILGAVLFCVSVFIWVILGLAFLSYIIWKVTRGSG